jgi:hypothetical protein
MLPDFRYQIFLATSFIYSAAVTFWQKFQPPGISGLAIVGISSSSMEDARKFTRQPFHGGK